MKTLSRLQGCWRLGVTTSLVLGGAIASSGNYALSQVIGDNTLGAESSLVTSPIPGVFRINGGATRGTNLFHSFSQFSIPTGGSAYFNNSLDIQNIITRITGESASNIDGLIRANGRANLFLINPNGIIFGQNARLNVRGSFVATTANALQFGSQGFWSASQPEVPQLLTVNPSAFFFNQIAAKPIINQSQAPNPINPADVDGLRVRDGRSLLLVGGDVSLEGGVLQAPAGRVELGGLAGAGTVGLNVDGNNLRLSFPSDVARADVSLTNEAIIDTSGNGSGDIQVVGRRITLTDSSQIVANTLGLAPGGTVSLYANQLFILNGAQVAVLTVGRGQGGTLNVTASDSVELRGGLSTDGQRLTGLFTASLGTGDAGDLMIATRQLVVRDGAQVFSGTFSRGQGGNLTISASNSVEVFGSSVDGEFVSGLFAQTQGAGDAGNLRIVTGQLLVRDGSQVAANTMGEGRGGILDVFASDSIELVGGTDKFPSGLRTASESGASGDAGDLRITTGKLIIRDGAAVAAATLSSGRGGTLTVTASKSVELTGASADGLGASTLSTQTEGSGDAGVLKIFTGRLILRDGAQILASTFDKGKGGILDIIASESVEVIGGTPRFPTALLSTSEGSGDAGAMSITTGTLIVRDGGQVAAATFGEGKGGTLMVTASRAVDLSGSTPDGEAPSGLFTRTEGSADAGVLKIVTGQLIVRNGARVEANTLGSGRGGTVDITASDSVELIGTTADRQFGSGLFAQSNGSGAAGDLRITTGQLLVQDRAQVSVSSDGTGKAGDIEVTARSVRLDNKGQITAETLSGNGGNIRLQLQDLLLMRYGSSISTSAGTAKLGGDGGNIAINAEDGFIVAVPSENSDIRANAFTGKGGNVQITAQGIFGTQFRPQDTLLSDITASSQFGVQGTVQINTPDVDPSRGLAELPVEPVNVEVAQGCQGGGTQASVEFFNTGRGGLSPNPYEPLSSSGIWEDVPSAARRTENQVATARASASPVTPSNKLVEAQGWLMNEKGEVVLVAQMPATHSQGRCRLR